MADLEFSLRLTADGDAFVGTVRVAKQEVEALGEAARSKAAPGTDEFRKQMREAETTGKLLADAIIKTTQVILHFANESINLGDRMADLAIGTGRSIAELQAYGVIAEKSGSDTKTLLGTIDFVAKGMSKAGDETGKYARALDFFGVSMVDANGKAKSSEQLAYDLATAYTASEKTAYAQAAAQVALGSNYAAQIPSLLALADKEKELNSLREYGALVDDNLAAASDRYNDSLVDVNSVMTAMGNELARVLIPAMQGTVDWFITSSTQSGVLEGTLVALGLALDLLVFAFKSIMSMVIAFDASIQMAGKAVAAFVELLRRPSDATAIWASLKAEVAAIEETSNKALTSLWTNIEKADKAAGPLRDRGGFFGGTTGKEAGAVVDLTEAIKKLESATTNVGTTTKHYNRATEELNALQRAGKVVTNDQRDALLAAAKALDDAEQKQRGLGRAVKDGKAEVVDYTKAITDIDQKIAALTLKQYGLTSETENYDKAVAQINKDLRDHKRVTEDQVTALIEAARKLDTAAAAAKEYARQQKYLTDEQKAYDEQEARSAKLRAQKIEDIKKLIVASELQNQQIIEEIAQVGMSIPQQIAYNAELERQKILKSDLDPLNKQILLDLVSQREQLQLQKVAVTENAAAWQAMVSNLTTAVNGFITDVINGGWSNAFKNLWNNFKAWAIQALTEIAAKQVVLSITASLGLGASGGANAGGLGGIFDSIVGGSGIGGIVKDLAGGLGSLLTGSLSVGTALGNLGTVLPTFTTLLEAGVGVTEAASAALAGMGASIGAVIPAIGAVVAAGTLIYNFVKSKEGGPKEGGFATTGAVPGIGGVDSTGRWITPNTQDAAMVKAVNTLNTTFESILTSLGGSGSAVFAQGFSTDPRGTAPSNVHTGAWVNGTQVFDNPNGNVGRSPEELQQELATQGMRAILAALQSSELPSVVADYLATIDVSTATLDQIDAALAHARELYEPIKALTEQVKALPEAMAEGMVAAIGVSPEIDAQIAAWAAEVEAFEIELAAFKEASDAFFASAGKVQDALDRDPQAEAMNAWAQAHQTTFEKVGIAKDALAALLVEYDGSTTATDDLAIATNAYRDAQVQALSQVYALRDALLGPEGLFSQTQHTLDWALMSKSEQTRWLIDEAVRQVEILKTTTDPAQIEKLAQTINRDLTQAFSLMSPEEQQAQHDYLKGILENAKNVTETQLEASEQLITDAGTSSGNVITLAEQALTDAGQVWLDAGAKMDETADKLKAAADDLKAAAADAKAASTNNVAASNTMAAAATTMETAANTPVPVEVTVNLESISGP